MRCDELKLFGFHARRMPEWSNVTGRQEIERLDLLPVVLSSVEGRKGRNSEGLVIAIRPIAGRRSKLRRRVGSPRVRRARFCQTWAIHSRSSLSGSVGFTR